MATHNVTTRNGIADYVCNQLDNGTLVFYQSDGITEVATLTFGANAFLDAVAGEAVATAITQDSDAAGGTTTIAKLVTGAAAAIVECTVGTTGAEINLSSNVISIGATVQVSSLTYTAPN